MSTIIDIADAVAAELNSAEAGTFSQDFSAQRQVLPVHELADLKDLKVTVVPKSIEITSATRVSSRHDFAIDIGIQKRVGRDMDIDVKTLGTLVDEITLYLRKRPLTGASFATWVGATNDPIFVPEHLAEQRTFTSVLTVTYRALTT